LRTVAPWRATAQVLRVFLKYTEISSWTVNQLWNGQEAPDYNRSHVDEEDLEREEFPLGPYRADLYLHTTVARAKVRATTCGGRC